tara:strand:- start:595 stop:750 length:156 start_codon:yes stop_codon:yes gene_type:complete
LLDLIANNLEEGEWISDNVCRPSLKILLVICRSPKMGVIARLMGGAEAPVN